MSKRVLILVSRSGGGTHVTDTTPTVAWEHEVAILEEIHGEGSCQVIEDTDDLLDREIVANRAKQIQHIVATMRLGQVFNGDPMDEYQRLVAKYGMHPEVKMAVVEKVYGSFRDGRFTEIVGSTKDYEDLTVGQLREMCEDLGITFRPSDKKPALISFVREQKNALDESKAA